LASNTGLTPQQNELYKAITDGLKPLQTPEANAALAELEMTRPQRDYAQVSGIELKGPPYANNDPDPHTYTRMGLFEVPPDSHTKARFLVSLCDAKGEEPSGKQMMTGGPTRIVPLDDAHLKALIQSNNLGDVSAAFTRLFQGMAAGESAIGWNAK
jgi:hypothetical protein